MDSLQVQERDRPVGLKKSRECYERAVRDYRKSLERVEDALVLKGLSLSEAYLEGRARVAVKFAPLPGLDIKGGCLIAVFRCDSEAFEARARRNAVTIQDVESCDFHLRFGGDQAVVFVSDVEFVDSVDFFPSYLERLYFIDDEIQHIGAREGSCFLSVKGGFNILPRIAERELCVAVDGAAICFDESAVCVVKGRPQVVDSITDNCRRVLGYTPAQEAAFPSARIRLGSQSFDVIHHVGPDNRFELLDVMIGPFYF